MKFAQTFLMTVALAACSTVPVFAALQTYTSLSNLESGVSDTFSNISFAQGALSDPDTVDGVAFSVNSPQLSGINVPSGWPTAGLSGTAVTATYGSNIFTITIVLPSGVNAVGLYADGQLGGSQVDLSVSDGTQTLTPSYTESGTTPGFFGFTTTQAGFTSLSITGEFEGTGAVLTVGDVVIGQADMAQTPEVATFLLVGTGLLCMGYFRRRGAKQKRATQSPLLGLRGRAGVVKFV